jgi:uncharacterized membrane protein
MASPANKEQKTVDISAAEKASIEVIEPKLEQIVERKVQVALRMDSFRGPMPPPEHLAGYDKIVPGCARTIVEEFQANSKHSRAMDLHGISGMIRRDARAQWMAFILVLVGFGLVWQLAAANHEKTAIAVATMLLGGIVTAFLTGAAPWSAREKPEKPNDDESETE